tara:strand:- start:3069 stop:3269 length:201 start_codon:yes stop_codon:yes gene_type:complete
MKKPESIARKECANYNGGKCIGVMFTRINGKMTMKLDKCFAGKNCKANNGDCGYFNQIVVRSSANA